MPWTSKATIANLVGAGYGSLEKLADSSFEQFSDDMNRYCALMGKDVRHSIEADNTWRIAKILPRVVAR